MTGKRPLLIAIFALAVSSPLGQFVLMMQTA